MSDENAKLLAAIDAVKRVHRRALTVQKRPYCPECADDRDIWAKYPCKTVKAIEEALK